MAKVRCTVCGEILDANVEVCPVCKAGKDKFVAYDENATEEWATEHKLGEGLACGDEEIIEESKEEIIEEPKEEIIEEPKEEIIEEPITIEKVQNNKRLVYKKRNDKS